MLGVPSKKPRGRRATAQANLHAVGFPLEKNLGAGAQTTQPNQRPHDALMQSIWMNYNIPG